MTAVYSNPLQSGLEVNFTLEELLSDTPQRRLCRYGEPSAVLSGNLPLSEVHPYPPVTLVAALNERLWLALR